MMRDIVMQGVLNRWLGNPACRALFQKGQDSSSFPKKVKLQQQQEPPLHRLVTTLPAGLLWLARAASRAVWGLPTDSTTTKTDDECCLVAGPLLP